VGQSRGAIPVSDLVTNIPAEAPVHAFERDTFLPGDEPEGYVVNARVSKVVSDAGVKLASRPPKAGEWVFDLIYLDEGHVFLGKHLHHEGMDPSPGNQPVIALPKDSPSRAYLKIEEAIHRFGPACPKGTTVLEVGCAPGGASTAMLNRGFRVTGVDPKRVDPSVHQNANFKFIQKTAKTLVRDDLKTINPEWLVLDMNLAPLEAIDEIHHVLDLLRGVHGRGLKLHQGFLTLKLNDWKFASSIPLYLKRVSELGFTDLIAVQLSSNRQEFFVYAGGFK
jgi:23S rRNA (cytidine2498-2'-O)-methyltransferase